MIDLNDDNYKESFKVLFDELKSHDRELVKKPSLILLTKSDSLNIEDLDIKKSLKDISVASISSISKQGVKDAILMIVDLIK